MRGLMRFLMMFGPMIFRQYQRYQQKKERQQYNQQRLPQNQRQHQHPQDNRGNNSRQKDYRQEAPRDGRYYRGNSEGQAPQPQQPQRPSRAKKAPPVLSEDEKNFNLKEEEFMLDQSTTAQYKQEMEAIEKNAKMSHEELLSDDQLTLNDPKSDQPAANKSTQPIERNDDKGFNIRDLFLKPDDEDQSES